MRENSQVRFRRGRKGFVLVAAALTIVMLIGILGLCQDLARMYVVRNELQAFADAAAVAAALELNGSQAHIDAARTTAQNYPDRWNFQVSKVNPNDVLVEFAFNKNGPWETNPTPLPPAIQFVRVTAQATLPLYFMPGFSETAPLSMALLSIARNQTLQARAVAGQVPVNRFYENLLPFSPDALTPGAPDFGYAVGSMYTLRWPPNGQRPDPKNPPNPGTRKWNNWCQGDRDANYVTPNPSAERGFIDIGDGGNSGGGAFIREAIVSNVQSHPMEIGDLIINVTGSKSTEANAMDERFAQDGDTASTTYAQYLANQDDPSSSTKGDGRRLVVVPVNNPANDTVVGFGLFFLHLGPCGDPNDNNGSCCAEYVGSASVPGRQAAAAGGAYKVRLLQ